MFSPCELRRICLEGKFDLNYLDAVEQLIQEEEKFLDRAAVDLPSSLAVFPYTEKVYDRKHGFRLLRDSVEICKDGVLVGFDVDHMAKGAFSVSWTWNDQPKTAVLRWHSRRCHHARVSLGCAYLASPQCACVGGCCNQFSIIYTNQERLTLLLSSLTSLTNCRKARCITVAGPSWTPKTTKHILKGVAFSIF